MSSLNSEPSTESGDQHSIEAPLKMRGPQIQFTSQDAQTTQGAASVVFFAE